VKHRVVVTGIGLVTPVGLDVESTWKGLLEGRSGVDYITRFDTTDFDTKIAGEVKGFEPEQYVDRKEARRLDRYTQFAVAAAAQAMDQSGLKITPENSERVGALVGTGIGGIETLSNQFKVLFEKGPQRISPFLSTMMLANMAAGQVAIFQGMRGPNFSTVSACASGAHAIGEGVRVIQRGDADAMVCGAGEAPIVPIGVSTFNSMRALSTRNDPPAGASRPFDSLRDGFIIAEGAGMLVLERYEHATARGARILAEIVGYGATADAHHVTAPPEGGEGAERAMRLALIESGLRPDDVDYINAHGTSTPLNDRAETQAIKTVLGEAAYKTPISSTKSMTGHLLGAAGAIEAAFSILAIQRGIVPPTINQENPDPLCDLDYVPNVARKVDVRVVVSNSFGFGGQNVSLMFRAC
jgi:3-oxoacyl-[acyl-carrier-protein] synthase II